MKPPRQRNSVFFPDGDSISFVAGVGCRAVSYESRRTEKNKGMEEGENETVERRARRELDFRVFLKLT